MAPVVLPNLREFSSGPSHAAPRVDAGTAPASRSQFFSIFGRCLTGHGIPDFADVSSGGLNTGVSGPHPGPGLHHLRHGKALLDGNASSEDPDARSSPSVLNSILSSGATPLAASTDTGVSPVTSADDPVGLILSSGIASGEPMPGDSTLSGETARGLTGADAGTNGFAAASGQPAGTDLSGSSAPAGSSSYHQDSQAQAPTLAFSPSSNTGDAPVRAVSDSVDAGLPNAGPGAAPASPVSNPWTGPDATAAAKPVRFSVLSSNDPASVPVPVSAGDAVTPPASGAQRAAAPASLLSGVAPATAVPPSSAQAGQTFRAAGSLHSTGPLSAANSSPANLATPQVQPAAVGAPGSSAQGVVAASRAVPAGTVMSANPGPVNAAGGPVGPAASARTVEAGMGTGVIAPSGNSVQRTNDGSTSQTLASSAPAQATVGQGHQAALTASVQPGQNNAATAASFASLSAAAGTGSTAGPVLVGSGTAHSGSASADSSSSGSPQQDNNGNKNAGSSPTDPTAALFTPPAPAHPAAPSSVAAVPDTSSMHRGLHAWDAVQNDEAPRSVSLASPNELHLSVHTAELGRVDLHATLHGDVVGATISVQKSDAGAAIAAGLPHLEHILHEQQIPVSHLSLTQGGSGMSQSNSSSHGQSGQHPRRTPWTGVTERTPDRPVAEAGPVSGETNRTLAGRLSIRA